MTYQSIVSGRILTGMEQALATYGIDAIDVGRSAGLDDSVWDNFDQSLPLQNFVRFLANACDRQGDESLAWTLGKRFEFNWFGELGQLLCGCRNLYQGLYYLCDYFSVLQSDTLFSLEVGPTLSRINYCIADPTIRPRRNDAVFSLGCLHTLVGLLYGNHEAPVKISLEPHPGSSTSALAHSLKLDSIIESETNSLWFPTQWLDKKIARIQPADNTLLNTLQEKRNHLQRNTPWTQRTRIAIYSHLGQADDQTHIARVLNVSRRTLRRHLAQDNVSFSGLLKECRMTSAKMALQHGTLPIAEIALRAGYADHSAFSRAFTRYNGLTPRQCRAEASQP